MVENHHWYKSINLKITNTNLSIILDDRQEGDDAKRCTQLCLRGQADKSKLVVDQPNILVDYVVNFLVVPDAYREGDLGEWVRN
jgi:hypothetical protein